MRSLSIIGLSFVGLYALTMGAGCAAGIAVQPGHRALRFDPTDGGIQHEVLKEGFYPTPCPFWKREGSCPRLDDFDVTYTTSKKALRALSSEGLPLDLAIAVTYRPIISELYLLDTEIGTNYFDEIIGPEFQSAAIGVFAQTSYLDLHKKNGSIEDAVEKQLRERLKGKHVEISRVNIENVAYAPEIRQSETERVVSQEQALRDKQLMENAAMQKTRELELAAQTKKLELETQSAQKKMELAAQTEQKKLELSAKAEQSKLELQAHAEESKLTATTKLEVDKIVIQGQTEQEKFRIESELRNKQQEKKLLLEQAQIDRIRAEGDATTKIATAKGEAISRIALAKATADETRASVANVTPMHVMMHAYDALGHLGGTGTTIMLGDWSRTPQFLFPKMPGFQQVWNPYGGFPAVMPSPAPAPSATNPTSHAGGNKLSANTDNPY
jgi:regulator of protease activity HflC (stomatin/prohibitin superfamily)